MTVSDFFFRGALIFDLDGTLIDSQRDLIRSSTPCARIGREQLHEDTISDYIGPRRPALVAALWAGQQRTRNASAL